MDDKSNITNFTSLNKPQETKIEDTKDFSIGNLAVKGNSKKTAKLVKRAKLTTQLTKQLQNVETIPISKGVSIVLFKDKGVRITKDITFLEILELEKNYPDAFVGVLPSLFEDFIVNDIIEPFVKIGDIVTVKRKFVIKNGDTPRRVEDIYFKALNDMTVIIALLEDGDLALTNTLIVC